MATLLGPFQIAIFRLAKADDLPPFTADTPRASFPVTFEAVFAALEAWPRMFIEPDGSFVWVSEERTPEGSLAAWQIDGHLYDRDDRLLYVELQGTCPRSAFEQLLTVCGVTLAETLIEQRRAGIVSNGEEFLAN
jgi:hypothetical protein